MTRDEGCLHRQNASDRYNKLCQNLKIKKNPIA